MATPAAAPVVPFALRAPRVLGAVTSALQDVVDGWAGAWGAGTLALEPAVQVGAGGALPAHWRQQWRGDGSAWCDWPAGLVAELRQLLFPGGGYSGGAGEPKLADAVAGAAFDALLGLLRVALAGAAAAAAPLAAPAPSVLAPGGGALLLRLPIGRAQLTVLLDAVGVARLAGPGRVPPLAPLPRLAPAQFLAAAPVALRVRAGQAELGAGALLQLAPGDVVRLDTSVDGAFAVLLGDAAVCGGLIGRSGRAFAVELCPGAPTPSLNR